MSPTSKMATRSCYFLSFIALTVQIGPELKQRHSDSLCAIHDFQDISVLVCLSSQLQTGLSEIGCDPDHYLLLAILFCEFQCFALCGRLA